MIKNKTSKNKLSQGQPHSFRGESIEHGSTAYIVAKEVLQCGRSLAFVDLSLRLNF